MGAIKSRYEAHKFARETARNPPDINDPAAMQRHMDRSEQVARSNMTGAQRRQWDNHKRDFDRQWNQMGGGDFGGW